MEETKLTTMMKPIKIGETHEIYEVLDTHISFADKKTGEIIEKFYYDLDTDVLLSKAFIEAKEAYKEKKNRRRTDKRGSWYNVPTEANTHLVLSISDRAFALFLSLYIDYDKPLNHKGKPLRNDDIAKLWRVYNKDGEKQEIGGNKISDRLSRLVKANVLERLKDAENGRYSNYKFNEAYFYQGEQTANEKFVKVYQKKLAEVIENVLKIEKRKNQNRKREKKINILYVIGLLHAIMPFVHRQSLYLVKNPEQKLEILGNESVYEAISREPSLLKKLPKARIAKSLGYKEMNRQTVDAYFKILADAGALKIDDTCGVKMYLMHPDLMYRKDNAEKEHLKAVRGMFGLHESQEKDEEI